MAHVEARLGNAGRERVLPWAYQVVGVVLVGDFNYDLCIIRLPRFRSRREPEPRPTSAHERSQRLQDALRLLVLPAVFFCNFPDDALRFSAGLRRHLQRSVLGQPDVYVRQVLQILGKELLWQLPKKHEPDGQNAERCRAAQSFR